MICSAEDSVIFLRGSVGQGHSAGGWAGPGWKRWLCSGCNCWWLVGEGPGCASAVSSSKEAVLPPSKVSSGLREQKPCGPGMRQSKWQTKSRGSEPEQCRNGQRLGGVGTVAVVKYSVCISGLKAFIPFCFSKGGTFLTTHALSKAIHFTVMHYISK